jgi:YaiO family outer membrane protein
MLEQHLTQSPDDVDARLVYGLVLSWEARYDEAREELRRVLAQTPEYMDARVALMNVELWSGRRQDAEAQAGDILAREPGNAEARLMRRRLEALGRVWTADVRYTYDGFSDGRGSWHEQAVSLSRSARIGSLVVRGSRAARFSRTDEQIEVELYPVFRAGTYAFVGFGASPDAELYPRYRGGLELFQSLGHGFEVSAGYRRMEFADVTHAYLGSLTKYVGTWMTTGRVYHVPGRGRLDSTSYLGLVRRYFGDDGRSFVGGRHEPAAPHLGQRLADDWRDGRVSPILTALVTSASSLPGDLEVAFPIALHPGAGDRARGRAEVLYFSVDRVARAS